MALVWPAGGLCVGLLLVIPSARRPHLLVGVGIMNFLANICIGHPFLPSFGFAVLNVIDPCIIVLVFERLIGQHERGFDTVRSVLLFSTAAAIGMPIVTGVVGAILSFFVYGAGDFAETWFTWSVTDSLGILVLAPLLVAWSDWRPGRLREIGVRSVATALLLFVLFFFLLELLIGSHLPIALPIFSRVYITFPLVFLWGYRYGMKGTTIAMLPVVAIMFWNTMDGPWSFVLPSASLPRIVTVQLFLIVLTITGLGFAALLKERAITLEHLRMSADHQRDLARRLEVQVERIPVGLIVLDRSGLIREWNPAAEVIFGYPAREAIGQSVLDRLIPVDRKGSFARLQDEVGKSDRSVSAVTTALHKNGTVMHVEWHNTPLRDERGILSGTLATVQDVTERDLADLKIHRLNHLYAFLSRINHEIIHARTRDELFQRICSVAVEYGKFKFAWIGEAERDGLTFSPVAFAGIDATNLTSVRDPGGEATVQHGVPEGARTVDRPIRVVQNIDADPHTSHWREQAHRIGFSSYATLPVNVPEVFTGVLNVYATDPGFFDAEELKLLEELRTDLSIALKNLDLEKRRQKVEEALHESETRFRTVVESVDDLVFMLDRSQRHVGIYGREAKRSGLSAEHFKGLTPADIFGEEEAKIHIQHNERALQGESLQYEWSTGTGAERRFFSTTLAPWTDDRGNIIGVSGVARDITSRMRMDDEIRP